MNAQSPQGNEFQKDNHYVPRLYLKRWADANNKVNTYRLLVPHQRRPLWKRRSAKGLAYHEHLYTLSKAGRAKFVTNSI